MNTAVAGIRFLRSVAARPMLDLPLVSALVATACFGLVVLYGASGEDSGTVLRQAVRLAIGLTSMTVIACLSPHHFRVWAPAFYALGLALLVLVAFLGEGRGAQRWLDLGIIRFQPSEILKLSLPMMLAWYMHRSSLPPGWRQLLVSLVIVAVPAVLIARQPDLGTAMLVATSGLFVVFLAGLSWRLITFFCVSAMALAPVLWHFMHDYQRGRVLTFLNPESDPLGSGWNIIQSKIAVGSGGLFGKGWMNSTQAHLEFLPERSTDFVLAVLAEEFGLLGVLLLFALYLYIIGRCLWLAGQAKDSFSRLLAGALGLTFFVYVMVNAGMISGLLPVVGVPLPLISYGGTSLISLLTSFGLIMSVYSHRRLLNRY